MALTLGSKETIGGLVIRAELDSRINRPYITWKCNPAYEKDLYNPNFLDT